MTTYTVGFLDTKTKKCVTSLQNVENVELCLFMDGPKQLPGFQGTNGTVFTLNVPNTTKAEFANTVNPDEMAQNELY